jgi:glycosyltransferase involved in cell wall biosynthesis
MDMKRDDSLPFVSCIMPTANRRRFVPMAMRLFLAQDYPEKELLILDDGEDSVADLIPHHPWIRYLRQHRRQPVGAKRNFACEEARGEIIAHWDDDDWYAPSRLRQQVEELIASGVDLCGIDRVLFLDPASRRSWEYIYPPGGPPWVYGATMCYLKRVWRLSPFPEVNVGEDTRFVAKVDSKRIKALLDQGIFVGFIHGANTSPKQTHDSRWRSLPLGRIEAVMGPDWPLARSKAEPAASSIRPADFTAQRGASQPRICVGVHVHSQPEHFAQTLQHLRDNSPSGIEVILLADGPDSEMRSKLEQFGQYRTALTDEPRGAAACFNRLLEESEAEILVFLESGSLVGPGWLDLLLAALAADQCNGLAGPTTNIAWNVQGAFRDRRASSANVAGFAEQAWKLFGKRWRPLEPLYCLADFCYVVRREVAEAIGGADQGYGLGPCWEMDYTVRAVRSGFQAVWAQGAYVFRHPFTSRRRHEEARLYETNKRRYQDAYCGLRLSGERVGYAKHCQGEACHHFAPADRIRRVHPVVPVTPASGPPPHTAEQARLGSHPGGAGPLVSCIMPTRDRLDWVLQSIKYFNRQSYANRELIIIDDGDLDLSGYLPHDSAIRYVRLNRRVSIGEKRNRACEVASGDVIVHWDDDDWYGVNRLSAQLQPLLAGSAEITAFTDTLFFDLDQWKFWKCSAQLYARLFFQAVHGGTLMFRRGSFGQTARYPDRSIAEDAWFLRAALAGGARLQAIIGDGLFAYLRHGTNSWKLVCGRELNSNGWRCCDEPPEIEVDREFYLQLSRAGQRSARSHGEVGLTIAAHHSIAPPNHQGSDEIGMKLGAHVGTHSS